ncbi:MAG: preprotein translocase subunit SecG [Gallionellaceae bacterium]
MTTVLIIAHVLVALTLIGVVLVQRGQGADMGASFGGGGAQTLFGSRGSGSFLGKLTGGLAATFMLTSLTLAFFSQQQTGSIVDRTIANQTPVEQASDAELPVGFNPALLKSDTPVTDGLPGAE